MVAPTTTSTAVAPEAGTRPRWNAERAHTVAVGLNRLAQHGYLSETRRQQLAARVEAVSSASMSDGAAGHSAGSCRSHTAGGASRTQALEPGPA